MIMAAALQRGLSLSDFDDLTVGSLIDYVVTYNNTYATDEESENSENKLRTATQTDFDNF